jgi:hypothetical protein
VDAWKDGSIMLKELLDDNVQYQNALFKRGFLITSKRDININEYPFYDNWGVTEIGVYSFIVHKNQSLYTLKANNRTYFLIGHAYNPFTMETDEVKILEKIACNAEISDEKYFDAINELTGLFLFGYIEREDFQILLDCAGMQIAYYGGVENKVYISSHMQLIGDICGLSVDPYIKELVRYKYYKLYGPFLPGDLSSYKEIKRIVPNTCINYINNEFIIERFFPKQYLEMCSSEEQYVENIKKIAEILNANMKLISLKWKKPAISMTGGMDSKTILACANGLYDKFSYFSYISMYGESIDAEAAHKIAEVVGINHKIYTIPDEEDKDIDSINKILIHNYGNIGSLNRNDIKKRIFFNDIEDFDIEVKSWVSEIGRANYYKKFGKSKMPKHLKPRHLTSMYKLFISNRKLVRQTDKVFEEYNKKTKFGENFSNYDESDMFLWEVRYGAWGGLVLSSEHRFSFDITVPYNNRKLLSLFLSLPLKSRIKDKPHEDIIKLMNSKIYETGISIVNYNETKKRMLFEKIYFNVHSLLKI